MALQTDTRLIDMNQGRQSNLADLVRTNHDFFEKILKIGDRRIRTKIEITDIIRK